MMRRRQMRILPATAFAGLLVSQPVRAIELETDLSTHYVEIRTNFQGAELMVFGAVTDRVTEPAAPVDLIVVVRGPPETVELRRKARLGLIWANTESIKAREVPSFYSIASTRPLDEIADTASLERYKIGFDHLAIGFDVKPARLAGLPANPPTNDVSHAPAAPAEPIAVPTTAAESEFGAFRQALIRLMKQRQAFREDAQLTFIRADLFRAGITIPPTVPAGAYGAEVYLMQNKAIVGAEYMVFFIDKKGLEGDVYGLAQRNPLTHGLLAVFIAAIAGWTSELVFRRR